MQLCPWLGNFISGSQMPRVKYQLHSCVTLAGDLPLKVVLATSEIIHVNQLGAESWWRVLSKHWRDTSPAPHHSLDGGSTALCT